MSELNTFEVAASGHALPAEAPVTPEATSPVPGTQAAPEPEYEIKWNGKTERLPLSKLQEFAQKGYDYTQKMQQLAKDREGWTGERDRYTQAISEIQQFLQDRQRLKAYLTELERMQGGAPEPQAEDDERPLTRAEVLALQQQREQALMGQTQQQIAQLQQQYEVNQIASGYRAELSTHIKGLTDQMPELQVVPDLEDTLKREVQAMRPTSIEEAKSYMTEVAKQHQARIQKFMLEARKAPVGPNPVLTRGIEPPGGTGPMPPAAKPFKSLSDPLFKQQVIADMLKTATGG